MKKWMRIILVLLGLPKSIWVNFRSLPFWQAIKMPILVSPNIVIISLKGDFRIQGSIHPGMISFGLTGYGLALHVPCVLQNNGCICFHGTIRMGGGTRICCNSNGTIEFGADIEFVGCCSIICSKSIYFGDKCLVSWDTQFMDTDMHMIFSNEGQHNIEVPIKIGEHVWICSKVNILKGTVIEQDSIVGGSSVVKGCYDKANSLICGNPACVIRHNVVWEE